MSQEDIDDQLYNLTRYGAIMEFLEPKARSFNNIPQSRNQSQRINCPANDGSYKSHYLAVQSSKNQFEWRVKRASKAGNCTVRISVDGENYVPLQPLGTKHHKFPCGRKVGYETVIY